MTGAGGWFNTHTVQGLAALVAVGTGVASAVGWLNRKRHPTPESIEPVNFLGRTRAAFLEQVWSQRIVNGLEKSLRHAADMELGLRDVPELVNLSYSQTTVEPGEEVLDIDAAYDQAGGQLVIVGPPGSGKTTAALKLMRHLLETARWDESAPVPEIFPLASWAKQRKPLLEWLADQVHFRHGWPPREARSLIWHHNVVPFLDGLDEVAPENREECLEQINRFWESHRGGPLVVCSRLAEYEKLAARLKLGGSVIISPPDAAQMDSYFAAAGARWDPVRAYLRSESSCALAEMLKTPLMLSITVLAYRDREPDELCNTTEDDVTQGDSLWSQYVSAMMT